MKGAVWLVTDVYPPGCGGSGWSAHALALTLVSHGHDVLVIGLDAARVGVSQRVFEGIRIVEVGVRRARRNPLRRLGSRDYAHAALEHYLRQRLAESPEVRLVHAQHLHSGPPAIAAAAACGRASVQTLRDYWPVCLHGTSWWGGDECGGCTNANLVGCMREYWGWPAPFARFMIPWARRRLAARKAGVAAAGRAVAVSEWVRHRIKPEVPAARFEVLPNIVDADAAVAAAAAAIDSPAEISERHGYLMAAGKLVATKGFDRMLADLAAAGCTIPVVIAGAGPERARLQALAASRGLEVSFTGWVPHDKVLRLTMAARAFLLPAAWNEPMSRLLLEALALGTPVIAWRSGGNAEPITPGVDAFVVEGREDLRGALAAVADPAHRERIGAAGARLARRLFGPAPMYERIMAVYDGAVADSRAAGAAAPE